MKKKHIILSYTLLFIESILFFIITILTISKFTIFRYPYVKDVLNKNNYYEELKDEIKTEMSYYTNQSGFEDEILDDTFTIGEVRYETNKFIENVYKGKRIKIDTQKFEERLNNNINKYIEKNNIEQVNDKEIKDFINALSEVYKDEIKLMGYAEKIAPLITKTINLFNKIFLVLIVLIILLFLLNNIYLKNNNIGVIFYTSGFLTLFSVIFIKNNIDIKNIFIYSKLVSTIIKSIINNVLSICIIIFITYMIIGLIMSLLKKRKKSN